MLNSNRQIGKTTEEIFKAPYARPFYAPIRGRHSALKQRAGRTVVVREPFVGMDKLKNFFLKATEAIPAQLGTIDGSGNVLLPDTLSEPSRKRKRASDSGSGGGGGNAGGDEQLAGMMMLIGLLEAAQKLPNPNDIEESADDYVFDPISNDVNLFVVRPEL